MAKKVEVSLVDDLDATQTASETVLFGIDGVDYEIDLSDKNAAELRGSLEKWVAAARRVSGSRRRGAPRAGSGSPGLPLAEIRVWALANGHKVSSRGRLSAEIVRAWREATTTGNTAKAEVKAESVKKSPAKAVAKDAPEFSAAGS